MDEKLNRYHDRCDQCTAQAWVVWGNGTGRLMFCGHHSNKNEFALIQQGFTILIDERDQINKAASASSGVAADDKEYKK